MLNTHQKNIATFIHLSTFSRFIIPLGNSVSSTIDYLNTKHQLKLKCFLKGFPHPSGLNARKNIQFKENSEEMCKLLTRVNF